MATKTQENVIYLRNYPKALFFYPLFFTSLILWIIQAFSSENLAILGYIWLIVFITNFFIVSFDFSSTKFFVLILAVVIIVLIVVFLVLPNVELPVSPTGLNLGLPADFYMVMTLVIGIILALVVLGNYFDYYKIETNEIYRKHGLFGTADRYPTKSLRLTTEITDVFEFFILRAGSITLIPGTKEVIHLPTVLNVKKKAEQIDKLLSHVEVE